MPTVNVLDVTQYPGDNTSQITYDGQKFLFNLGLVVNVQNPNVLPIFLSDMKATVSRTSIFLRSIYVVVVYETTSKQSATTTK